MEQSEKLQKILSRMGLGSRRALEEVITQGRVSINGKIAKLGDRAVFTDVIRVDGRVIKTAPAKDIATRVFLYNKPEGEVCTRKDPQGRPSVYDRLPSIASGRLINIGRLDLNTTGLLLFTNDGELAHRLMHPANEIPREYSVRVFGEVTDEMMEAMRGGVDIDGEKFTIDSIRFIGGEGINRWYSLVLHEGKNREIRKVFESFELKVSRLIRVRFGDIHLDRDLPRGGWKELSMKDVNYLRSLVDLPRLKNEESETTQKENGHERHHRMMEIKRAVRRHEERRRSGAGSFRDGFRDGASRAIRGGASNRSATGRNRSAGRGRCR